MFDELPSHFDLFRFCDWLVLVHRFFFSRFLSLLLTLLLPSSLVLVRYDQRAEALGKKGMIQTDNM